jgi:hypothetical protein
MDGDSLALRIAEAFRGVSQPARFVSHQCPECESVQTAFEGRQWSEVPIDTISDHRDSLPLLTPEAYVFLLPAYMTAAVREPLSQIAPMVLYSLQPSGNRRQCPLTEQERALILEVAEWLAECESWGVKMDRVRKYWAGHP